MYGRRYIIAFTNVAVTADQDLFEILCPTDACMVLHECKVTQSSDAGDSESEQVRFQIKRGIGSTSGSGGSSGTVNKMQTGDAAAGITAEINNTTIATAGGGSLTTLLEVDENIHNGWHYLPAPEDRIIFSPGEECYINLAANPADSLTMSGYAIVEEIGG